MPADRTVAAVLSYARDPVYPAELRVALRQTTLTGARGRLRHDVLNHVTADIRQTKLPALKEVSQFLVIDSQEI